MKKSLVFLFCIFSLILLASIIFAADPTDAEKRFYNVLKYRYNLHKDLAPTSIDEAMGTMEKELLIKFDCPKPPPKEGKIKIKTKLVSWAGGEKAGYYEWKCSVGTDGNEKIMECENEISFDLGSMLPEPGLDKQSSNVGTFYHEWLHGQLLINAMRTPAWQAEFCKCNIDWGPADLDDPHTTIPGLQGNFTANLTDRVVNIKDPWNSTGNPSDKDGDGIKNEDDKCPNSFDREQSDNDEDGLGDACDEDDDNDGIEDENDNCPLNENLNQFDSDGDGLGDVCDSSPADYVLPGADLFETLNSFLDLSPTPIPAGFFDPGSQPFGGVINLRGEPLDPLNLGTTDTIIQRLEPANLPLPLPSQDTIPIEMIELSLVSTSPITVTYNGGNLELWDVKVELSHFAPSMGQMTIIKTHENGGTFTSEFFVQPRFIFTKHDDINEVRVYDTREAAQSLTQPLIQLNTNEVPWVFECSDIILRVDGLTSNFCASVTNERVLMTESGIQAQLNLLPTIVDADGDVIPDNTDNCPNVANPSQEDTDRDGLGDACDYDSDNDGVIDEADACPGTILTPISHGCSCFQILMIKPGPNHKEWINGCSEKTIKFFEAGEGWAKKYFSNSLTHNR